MFHQGRDLVARFPAVSGTTAAFLIAACFYINASEKGVQAGGRLLLIAGTVAANCLDRAFTAEAFSTASVVSQSSGVSARLHMRFFLCATWERPDQTVLRCQVLHLCTSTLAASQALEVAYSLGDHLGIEVSTARAGTPGQLVIESTKRIGKALNKLSLDRVKLLILDGADDILTTDHPVQTAVRISKGVFNFEGVESIILPTVSGSHSRILWDCFELRCTLSSKQSVHQWCGLRRSCLQRRWPRGWTWTTPSCCRESSGDESEPWARRSSAEKRSGRARERGERDRALSSSPWSRDSSPGRVSQVCPWHWENQVSYQGVRKVVATAVTAVALRYPAPNTSCAGDFGFHLLLQKARPPEGLKAI